MVTANKHCVPMEAGTYIIRSSFCSSTLNLIRGDEPQDHPHVCLWNTLRSPTEKWYVEPLEKSYVVRNVSTGMFMAYNESQDPRNKNWIWGSKRPMEWIIEFDDEGHYVIRLASNPELVMDVHEYKTKNGSPVNLWKPSGVILHNWTFEKIEDASPPSYIRQIYVGPVPAGTYWLCQPDEEGGPQLAGKARSAAALTVAARAPLEEDMKAFANLSGIGDGPWPNQVWVVEPGIRGYRFRNLGTKSYLNFVDRMAIMESDEYGMSSVTEWTLAKDKRRDPNDVPDWWIRPSSDHGICLGVSKGVNFNRLRAKAIREFEEEWGRNWVYCQWRFETFDEKFLQS